MNRFKIRQMLANDARKSHSIIRWLGVALMGIFASAQFLTEHSFENCSILKMSEPECAGDTTLAYRQRWLLIGQLVGSESFLVNHNP